MFAKIQNDTVVEWPIVSIYPLFPNTSFPSPLTPADLPEGYVMVGASATPQVGLHQKAVSCDPVLQGAQWVQGWRVEDLTQVEILERNDMQARSVRGERNAKLSGSDWTQVADAPVDQAAWVVYRQVLRDVTAQAGFPWATDWPVPPQDNPHDQGLPTGLTDDAARN